MFDEPAGDKVAPLTDDCELVAPSLMRHEMANVCWVKLRRKPEEQAALLAALRMPGFVAETLDIDHHAVVELASQTGLTRYDASYLWFAVELVTLDRQLAEAAEKFQ